MTAVEQLIDQLTSVGALEIPQGSNVVTYIIEQAKEMEKKQKIEFANKYAKSDSFYCGGEFDIEKGAEQYYNETFKSE